MNHQGCRSCGYINNAIISWRAWAWFLVWECGIDCSIGHTCVFVCETYYSVPLSRISENEQSYHHETTKTFFQLPCWLQFNSQQEFHISLCHHVQIAPPHSFPVDARTHALELNNLKMTIYLHLVKKSQTHGTAPPLSLYTFVSWCLGRGQLCLFTCCLVCTSI